jgi:uncharacterized protein YndB with AHSA1/START domain
MATTTNKLQVTVLSDTELQMTRLFDAPKPLVFEAFTKCEHLKRWWGPRNMKLDVCELDFRVGGNWRFVQVDEQGEQYPFKGEFLEIHWGERIKQTSIFDVEPFNASTSIETLVLSEQGGKTLFTATVDYGSKEALEAVVASGMEAGAAESYDRLEELLPAMALNTSLVENDAGAASASARGALLKAHFEFARMMFQGASSIDEEVARKQVPGATINPILTILAHAIFNLDGMINGTAAQQEPVIARGDWRARTGIPGDSSWQTEEWVATNFSLEGVRAYGEAVFDAALAFLDRVTDTELDRQIQTGGGPFSIASFIAGPGIAHFGEHMGEISALQGVQGIKGPY